MVAPRLGQTPWQTVGPFFHYALPHPGGADLVGGSDAGARPDLTAPGHFGLARLTRPMDIAGETIEIEGQVLDGAGEPLPDALVEIWQADNNGAYLHTKTGNAAKRDGNFQGFGRFLTGSNGEYVFRTIKPVPYKPRTPHIHLAVKIKGKKELITQCYIKGHELNANDMVYKGIKDAKQRESVTLDFNPLKGSKAGEFSARWDVVLGFTPEG